MSTNPETPKAECPCAECNRPMRPRGVLLREMPGTMAWGHSGKCKSCVQPNGPTDRNKTPRPPKPIEDPKAAPPLPDGSKDVHLENTISGLNTFLAARERRLRIQASKQNAFAATGGHRLPAPAPKAVQRPLRKAA